MDWQGTFVVILSLLTLGAAITERVTLDVIGITSMLLLVVSGVLSLDIALSGFSNRAVVTLAGLYVIAEGVTKTGALEFLARWMMRASRGSMRRLLFTLCAMAAVFSSLVSDTAVVLVLLPVTLGLAREFDVSPSKLLIPVAYSALLGGMLTLVGSSVNLLTSGAAESFGVAPIGMFEMTPYAAPVVILGILFMVFFAAKWLPDRVSVTSALSASPREYVTELILGSTSPLIGKIPDEITRLPGIKVLFLVRDEQVMWPPYEQVTLAEGDVVMLQGNVGQLVDLQTELGLRMVGDREFDARNMRFFELAVSPHSRMLGRRIGSLNLARDYDVAIVAVLRKGHHVHRRASDFILRAGDLILVCGGPDSRHKLDGSTDFYLLIGAHRFVVLRAHAKRALMVLSCVVLAFIGASLIGGDRLSIPAIALGGAMAMVLTGCLTARRAYRTIDWSLLVFVVSMLALGRAIEITGVAALCATGIVSSFSDMGPWVLVSLILGVATLLNQFLSPYAVCVLLTPIALTAAKSIGVTDLRPFVLAVAFGGSNAFCTPLGHQVNLMVMGPGGYRYADFFRLGVPLTLLVWVVISFGFSLT